MSRIYWDTMLFIYWIEEVQPHVQQIQTLFSRMAERGDRLCTSVFTLGELLVGPVKANDRRLYEASESWLTGPDVELIPYTADVARRFADIRGRERVKAPDAIHLASAAGAGIDLFLTNDYALRRLTVEGIKFIDGIDTTVLGVD